MPFRAIFEQNIGLEHISSTKKVNDFVENLNSCKFLEGLSCYQPFEHITCHLTTFRRPNWPISCGYTCLLPKVTLWVIALGWDQFGFPVRFSPPVTLQIITQGQLLIWQYLAGNFNSSWRSQTAKTYGLLAVVLLLLIRPYLRETV